MGMNVVALFVDTLRYDHVSANGTPDPELDVAAETPNLDSLAARSYAFDRAFAASFPTIAHRTDVITGRYGAPFHPWSPLDTDVPTLPRQLSEAGYVTQLIHDTPHLVNGGHRFDYPFQAWTPVRGAEVDRAWISDDWSFLSNWTFDDRFDGLGIERDERAVVAEHNALKRYVHVNRGRRHHEDWNAARLFRTAGQFLQDNASRENFFLWLDCFDPHEPWDAPPEYVRKYDADGDGRIDPRSFHGGVRNHPDLPESGADHVAAQYAAKVEFVDHWLGYFLDTLEATGLAENTALLVMSDHGTNLGEFPGRGFGKAAPPGEREAHVPLFLAVPGAGSGRTDALVQPQDVFATVANLAGADVPDGVESHDLRSIAERDRRPREIALSSTVVSNWEAGDVLGYASDGEWSLGLAADPADCELRRFGGRAEVSDDHPAVRDRLRSAAVEELDRRGLDPAVRDWLESEGETPFPGEYEATDASGRPPGWQTYFNHPFNE